MYVIMHLYICIPLFMAVGCFSTNILNTGQNTLTCCIGQNLKHTFIFYLNKCSLKEQDGIPFHTTDTEYYLNIMLAQCKFHHVIFSFPDNSNYVWIEKHGMPPEFTYRFYDKMRQVSDNHDQRIFTCVKNGTANDYAGNGDTDVNKICYGPRNCSTEHKTTQSTTTEQVTSTTKETTLSSRKTTTATAATTVNSDWVIQGQRQLRAVYNVTTYKQAKDSCNTNLSLVMFASPMSYLNLTKALNLTNGVYWVSDLLNIQHIDLNDSSAMCLLLNVTDNTTVLLTKPCTERHFSICSRSKPEDEILNQPEFTGLIQNMTVGKKKTAQARRRLNSAEDKRVVSKAVGSIGISVLCVVFGILLFFDLPRLLRWCRQQMKKKKKTEIELKSFSESVS